MRNNYWIILIIGWSLITACKNHPNSHIIDEDNWKLGWRMIDNSMDENLEIADLQFDSLLNNSDKVDRRFLITGLEIKSKLNKKEAIVTILSNQNKATLRVLCKKEFLTNFTSCNGLSEEKVKNEPLKMELLKMYVNDQATRGYIMKDIIKKYNLDSTKIIKTGEIVVDEKNRNRLYRIFDDYGFSNQQMEIIGAYLNSQEAIGKSMKDFIAKYDLDSEKINGVTNVFVDEQNRERLKEIFKEYGFPTKELVGKDVMHGIFLMIQHGDGDKEWQKSQLTNIEEAVNKGDMSRHTYAYLYDRIKVNAGEKQLYGTQFAKVNPIKKIAKLADTEDLENLDTRRRKVGMMPITMYKKIILSN